MRRALRPRSRTRRCSHWCLGLVSIRSGSGLGGARTVGCAVLHAACAVGWGETVRCRVMAGIHHSVPCIRIHPIAKGVCLVAAVGRAGIGVAEATVAKHDRWHQGHRCHRAHVGAHEQWVDRTHLHLGGSDGSARDLIRRGHRTEERLTRQRRQHRGAIDLACCYFRTGECVVGCLRLRVAHNVSRRLCERGERGMAVRGRGAVVTWPTIALLVVLKQSRGRGADLALHVDGHDAMATLAFARALVEEGHGRVRLLLVQAHALRPSHLGGEFIVHGCCFMSGWVQGSVALARPPRGGGTVDKDPAGTGLGHGLAGLSMPIRSMPRAPSMQLVEHMEAAAAIVLFPCNVLRGQGSNEAKRMLLKVPQIFHFSISRATQNQV